MNLGSRRIATQLCALAWSLLVACGDDASVRGGTDAANDAVIPIDTPAEVSAEVVPDVAPEATPEVTPVDAVADTVPPDTAKDEQSTPDVPDEPDSVAPDTADTTVDSDTGDDEVSACQVCSAIRPIILVHGINGGPENFDVMAARLIADGWPPEWVVRFKAADPSWGCNVDNAAALAKLVDEVAAATCQPRVDIVAHSMGSLSSRYYVKNLGGQTKVNTYVTLGGMHHGLLTPCFAPEFLGVCVWQELCQSGAFIAQLNADPATPGDLYWVSIYGSADTTVPNDSSHLDGAENIVIDGAEHDGENGLVQRADAYAEVKRVLGYACW